MHRNRWWNICFHEPIASLHIRSRMLRNIRSNDRIWFTNGPFAFSRRNTYKIYRILCLLLFIKCLSNSSMMMNIDDGSQWTFISFTFKILTNMCVYIGKGRMALNRIEKGKICSKKCGHEKVNSFAASRSHTLFILIWLWVEPCCVYFLHTLCK